MGYLVVRLVVLLLMFLPRDVAEELKQLSCDVGGESKQMTCEIADELKQKKPLVEAVV